MTTTSNLVLCQSADGWSLHPPGCTDEAIACGDAPLLLSGRGRPTRADYKRATAARAVLLAEATADAYSWDAYGEREWAKAIGYLIGMGLDDREVEAVMRSKLTRWARDEHSTYEGKGIWVKQMLERDPDRAATIADLVAGTF